MRGSPPLGALVLAPALALALVPALAGCVDLLANAPCDDDDNCPNDTVCVAGTCTDPALAGEGEGEGGEGEGEGGGGEGEGEGEGEGDPCAPGAAVIESDEDLAAFAGCAALVGDIAIEGAGITSLAPLGDVEVVDGDLSFADLDDAEDFEALDDIALVTGDLAVEGEDAENVMEEGLVGLVEVGGDLVVRDTENATLRGFGALEEIGGALRFEENDALASFGDGAFASLDRIGDGVTLEDNPALRVCVVDAAFGDLADVEDLGGNSDASCD